MPILLDHARFRDATPRFRDFGGTVGEIYETRLNRPGNRYAISFGLPPVPEEPEGRILMGLLKQAKLEGALYPWPQPGLRIGSPGAPVVDGAVSAGSVLSIRGLTPNYAIRFNQFFSIVHAGHRWLHSAYAAAVADASGEATVTLNEMLRTPLSDGDTIELAKPMIEGLLGGGDLEHEIMQVPFVQTSFTISEQS